VTLRRTRAAIREATPTRRRPASQGTTPPCLEESWAGWLGIPGAASLPVDAQATFLRVHGRVPGCWLSGVSALMRSLLQLRAIGARYATASALPQRRGPPS
jgi:hypothetical protein